MTIHPAGNGGLGDPGQVRDIRSPQSAGFLHLVEEQIDRPRVCSVHQAAHWKELVVRERSGLLVAER